MCEKYFLCKFNYLKETKAKQKDQVCNVRKNKKNLYFMIPLIAYFAKSLAKLL